MNKSISALVVDDHKSVCEGLAALAEKTGLFDKVYTAFTVDQALQVFKTKWIHVALIDARMPGMGGIELIKLKNQLFPSIKSVCITSFDEEDTLKEIWATNVNGILLKRSTDADEIRECLRQVINDGQYFSPEIRAMVHNFRLPEESNSSLTAREKEILQRICIGQSSKEIAIYFKLSVTTVEDYRKSMLRKAKVKNTPELVDYAHRNGLV